MLQTRRDLARLVRQTYGRSRRRSVSSTNPPGEPSGHAASAGQHGAGHHSHHPEPVNESFGVRTHLVILDEKEELTLLSAGSTSLSPPCPFPSHSINSPTQMVAAPIRHNRSLRALSRASVTGQINGSREIRYIRL